MMSEATLGEISANLDGHIKVDEVQFLAVTKGIDRIETAIVDHAKSSSTTMDKLADMIDKVNVRTHARMDGIVASIAKLADGQAEIKDNMHTAIVAMTKADADVDSRLNKRISSTKDWIMGGFVIGSLPVIGWMAVELWGTK